MAFHAAGCRSPALRAARGLTIFGDSLCSSLPSPTRAPSRAGRWSPGKYCLSTSSSAAAALEGVPDTMRAVVVEHDHTLVVRSDVPVPRPGPGECLIKVQAAGVNRPDVLQRKGLYPPPPGACERLGLEVAGVVVETGSEAIAGDDGSAVSSAVPVVSGMEVCALTNGGGYAEYCLVPQAQCLPIPPGLSLIQAAILPETYFTVWFNVFQQCGLQPGESLLVHGGGGGIGSTAIQLGKAFGATVVATAGSADRVNFCKSQGADLAINYREESFVEAVASAECLHKRGVDVLLDCVGGPYFNDNLKCLGKGGRMSIIGFLGGPKAEVNLLPIMLKGLHVTGSTLRPQPLSVKGKLARELYENVWPLLSSGKISPALAGNAAQFALDDAGKAHEAIEGGQVLGKAVLLM